MNINKLQEMADDLGITFVIRSDGSVAHHPPGAYDPPGALIIRPQKGWDVSPHGAVKETSDAPPNG